ncbi:MAG: hypothetical protein K5656_03525 [Lachnospiraceae bacterium]|nr:hypothetical protein [Lachnospiraceae bacterium]
MFYNYVKQTHNKGIIDSIAFNNKRYKYDSSGYEGASEYIASNLLSQTNIKDYVSYTITIFKNNGEERLGCYFDDFVGEKTLFSPLNFIYFNNIFRRNLKECLKLLDKVVPGAGIFYTQMLEFDRFILNTDRYFHNMCMLENEDNSFSLAPLYDNSYSFLLDAFMSKRPKTHCSSDEFRASLSSKPFYDDFDRQVNTAIDLYGSQLKIKKNLSISDEVKETVAGFYGDEIVMWIERFIEEQKDRYGEYLILD